MRVRAPAVKVPDYSYTLGIRRPDREMSARTLLFANTCGGALNRVGTELFVCAEVRAFAEEIDVLFRQHGVERSKPHAYCSLCG